MWSVVRKFLLGVSSSSSHSGPRTEVGGVESLRSLPPGTVSRSLSLLPGWCPVWTSRSIRTTSVRMNIQTGFQTLLTTVVLSSCYGGVWCQNVLPPHCIVFLSNCAQRQWDQSSVSFYKASALHFKSYQTTRWQWLELLRDFLWSLNSKSFQKCYSILKVNSRADPWHFARRRGNQVIVKPIFISCFNCNTLEFQHVHVQIELWSSRFFYWKLEICWYHG